MKFGPGKTNQFVLIETRRDFLMWNMQDESIFSKMPKENVLAIDWILIISRNGSVSTILYEITLEKLLTQKFGRGVKTNLYKKNLSEVLWNL